MKSIKARNFTASLQGKTASDVQLFLDKTRGYADAFAIHHTRDKHENGEPKTEHTHFVIYYDSPRSVTTVANLLDCPENMIEIVRSKVATLEYLLHINNPEKAQYTKDELYGDIERFNEIIKAYRTTNDEIKDAVMRGDALSLLSNPDISPSRVRSIQSLVHFAYVDKQDEQMRELKQMLSDMNDTITKQCETLENISRFCSDVRQGFLTATEALNSISTALNEGVKVLKKPKR